MLDLWLAPEIMLDMFLTLWYNRSDTGLVPAIGRVQAPDKRDDLNDDETVTQISDMDGRFRNRPRPKRDDDGISVVRGKWSITEAKAKAFGQQSLPPSTDEGVRHATVGNLRQRGFDVDHRPTNNNRDHVTVGKNKVGHWSGDDCRSFDEAFGEEGDRHD